MRTDRLIQLRKEKKLRQKDVAKKIGVARTTYAMYEQGQRSPDYDTLQRIADFFETTRSYLLGDDETTDQTTREQKIEELEAILRDRRLLHDGIELTEEEKEEFIDYVKFRLRRKNQTFKPD